LPGTDGVMVKALSLTVWGSRGRSNTTAIGEVTAMPCVPWAGTTVRAESPAGRVVNSSLSGSVKAVPAWS